MKTNYNKILTILTLLNKEFPKYSLGVHIASSLEGHDIFNISDKAFLDALSDYYIELTAIDVPHNNNDVEDIIRSGMNLHIEEEEEE